MSDTVLSGDARLNRLEGEEEQQNPKTNSPKPLEHATMKWECCQSSVVPRNTDCQRVQVKDKVHEVKQSVIWRK